MNTFTQTKNWKELSLLLAGIYNILWGSFIVIFPLKIFQWVGAEIPRYPQIWQCVGMIVAVYGVGYIIAAKSPSRYWPIILVGLLGKIFGPIGFIWSLAKGVFPIAFGWNIVFNDLIWWLPFVALMKDVWKENNFSNETLSIGHLDFEKYPERYRAKFINSLSGFKSSNLIGTINNQGQTNLSIVSSVFHLGASPALIGFIIRPDKSRRDTLENIRENGSYTINHVNESIVVNAHQTSARYPINVSEFDSCELTAELRDNFKAPFVAESRISLAVEFIREQKIEENGTHLIIGKILRVYLPKDCVEEDGHVNIEKAGTVCVSGLDSYSQTIKLGRLTYAKTERWPKWF